MTSHNAPDIEPPIRKIELDEDVVARRTRWDSAQGRARAACDTDSALTYSESSAWLSGVRYPRGDGMTGEESFWRPSDRTRVQASRCAAKTLLADRGSGRREHVPLVGESLSPCVTGFLVSGRGVWVAVEVVERVVVVGDLPLAVATCVDAQQ